MISRREFLRIAGAAAAFAALPPSVRAATTPPRVVIVGGGFAGATAAKYLRLWGQNVDVTLVEANARHYACILSNLVVTGAATLDRITLNYDSLRQNYGVKVVQGKAVGISTGTVTVSTSTGSRTLPYDHLILAPGIDFIAPAGSYDPNLTPHAWQAGAQTTLLKNQLANMPNGGVFVLTIPKSPYRCPPGPYERACVVADYLKRRKPRSKVIVFDANDRIQAEPANFGYAFSTIHAGYLEYHPNMAVSEVVSGTRTVKVTDAVSGSTSTVKAAVLNILPGQKAGKIVSQSGLCNDPSGRWARVDPLSYGSTAYGNIHVIGDSQATGQPKSGHMANSQAKVCADAILRAFAGEAPDPNPVTNSACYSPITATTASWLTAAYQYDPATGLMTRVPEAFGEAEKISGDNYEQMFKWADNIFADSFS